MKIVYDPYEIELVEDKFYSTQSADNIKQYSFEYSKGKLNEERFHPISKKGIIVKDITSKEQITSAIICENGGASIIHDKSYFVDQQKIWILVSDKIYCLNLPYLDIEWYGRYDYATNFSIHPFKEDFIIHGELEIFRINRQGVIQWRFGARDVFINENGTDNFFISNNRIKVQDWEGYWYLLDENGMIQEE